MDKILEQDLMPIEDETPGALAPVGDNSESDLEEVEGDIEAEEMGESDYQYVLTVEQEDAEDGQNLEPEFTFLLTPKEIAEEEENDELEQIEVLILRVHKPLKHPLPLHLPHRFLNPFWLTLNLLWSKVKVQSCLPEAKTLLHRQHLMPLLLPWKNPFLKVSLSWKRLNLSVFLRKKSKDS